MRKLGLLAATVALVAALAAVAYAAQVNTYGVNATTSPASAGSKKKPVPIALNFRYTVGEESGQRPSPVKRYRIAVQGMQNNAGLFPSCTAQEINDAGDDSGCSKKALVGTGSIDNATGSSSDPNDRSIKCAANIRFYAGGKDRVAIYVYAGPPTCPITLSTAIDGRFVKVKGGQALQFEVPSTLLHPVTGLDNAVVEVVSKFPRKTVTAGGKQRGFYELVGGCKGGKRAVEVQFVPESGAAATATSSAKC
ncbi:MAG TPA: hypothetical protein VFR97_01625 [Capillimicrobium sp.]|nr:hypothetical protein [Capillimicrobium sp.]